MKYCSVTGAYMQIQARRHQHRIRPAVLPEVPDVPTVVRDQTDRVRRQKVTVQQKELSENL